MGRLRSDERSDAPPIDGSAPSSHYRFGCDRGLFGDSAQHCAEEETVITKWNDKIVQIAPAATNWEARFKDRNTGEITKYQVVCWALVERTEEDGASYWVRGMLSLQGFDCLIFPDEEGTGDDEFIGFWA
jgi:hypothetical protein